MTINRNYKIAAVDWSDESSVEPSPSEFAALVKRHASKAYNFAFYLVRNEQDARDLVQEAFTRVLRKWSDYDSSRSFEPWFNRILKNIFLDSVRRYEHNHSVSLDSPSPVEDHSWEQILPGHDQSPIEELGHQETIDLVRKALDSLQPLYKSVLVLCDIEQYPYERIAEILDCPLGTVRSRIHQGRKLFRVAFLKLQQITSSEVRV